MRVSTKAVIPMSAEDYWRIRDTPEFWAIETRILKNASKLCAKEIRNDAGDVTGRILKTMPDLSGVPGFLLSMLPEEGIVYTDNVTYVTDDAVTPYAFRCTTSPNIYSDSCNIKSYVRVTPVEGHPKACVQSITIDISVDVWLPGVGAAVEGLVKSGIMDGYENLPRMVKEYISQYLSDTDSGYELSDLELSPELLRDVKTQRHSIDVELLGIHEPHRERRRSSFFGGMGRRRSSAAVVTGAANAAA